MFRPFSYLLLGALVTFSPVRAASAQQQSVTAFAAASLSDALNSIGKTFTNQTNVAVRFSFASSAVLAKQIDQGAPADIFASADIEWMDWLKAHNLIQPQTRIDLLGNKLVIVAPASAKFSALPLAREAISEAVGQQGRIATGEVNSVPAGIYAKAALEKLGLWNALGTRLAQSENVRAALALVARQETPLGIVYETDAKAEPRVKVVATFPADSHPPIIYPFALTTNAKGEGPERFLSFLQGDAARAVFASQGFTLLSPARLSK